MVTNPLPLVSRSPSTFYLLPSTFYLLPFYLTSHFSLLTSNFSPRLTLVRVLAHLAGKHDQAAIGVAGARDFYTGRRPGERARRRIGLRREDRHRIHAAPAGVARERHMS